MATAAQSLMLTSGASGRINALFSVRALKSLLAFIHAVVILFLLPFRGGGGRRRSGSAAGDGGGSEKGARAGNVVVPWKKSGGNGNGNGIGGRAMAAMVDQEVAARRTIAMKRVLQDDDRQTVRDFSMFVTARGDTVFTQSWFPVSGEIRGVVVLMHGLNEHSGRYNEFAKQLNRNGYKVYGMDWIGHGGSDGLHAYIPSLDYAVSDLKSYLDKVMAENPGLPCFCFGHSTGAAIVLRAALDPKVEASLAGMVLTSPAVGVQPSHPLLVILAPVVSILLPRYQFSAANKKGMPVSRDADALIAKYTDPLVYTGSIRVRTGYEILRNANYLQQNLNRFKVPFLVLHGSADTVTDPEGSRKFYDEASSSDKTIKLLDGYLHDLLFEPERQDIMDCIIEWLNSRV
ncbi:Monoglyceride lipase [Linum grandiflorum]